MSERRFLTWCLEDGETEEDFKITFAHDEEDAAVRRAQHDFHRGDPFNSTAIAVRREGGNGPHGPVIVFDVEVRAEPGFYAHARAKLLAQAQAVQENALQQAREDIDTALECIGAQNEAEPTMQTVSDAITFLEFAAGELLDLFRILEANTGDDAFKETK